MSHLDCLSEVPTLIGDLMRSRPQSEAGGQRDRRRMPQPADLPAVRLSSGNDLLPMEPSIKRLAGIDPPPTCRYAV